MRRRLRPTHSRAGRRLVVCHLYEPMAEACQLHEIVRLRDHAVVAGIPAVRHQSGGRPGPRGSAGELWRASALGAQMEHRIGPGRRIVSYCSPDEFAVFEAHHAVGADLHSFA